MRHEGAAPQREWDRGSYSLWAIAAEVSLLRGGPEGAEPGGAQPGTLA